MTLTSPGAGELSPAGGSRDSSTLPSGGATRVAFAGPAASRWLAGLARQVDRAPADATFAVRSGGIDVVPARLGRKLDLEASRRAVERAVLSPAGPRARSSSSRPPQPARSTAQARAMGITGVVGSYTTTYGGTPGRLHNVQLVAELIDGALVAPGARFSFNETTGERNEAKGFEEAPVIINGELQTGIGGGVCQVSTTLFNAVFEAGLSIERADEPRALHQPLPARSRRDRQLPGHRPRLHERHGQVAARADVRRRRLAHREPLRHAAEPARRDRHGAARGRGQGAVEADRGPHDVQGPEGRRAVRRAAAVDERDAACLRVRRDAHVRLDLELVLRRRADRRPPRDETAAEGAREAARRATKATPKTKTPAVPRPSATTR